jgi:hypothetical protein
MQASLVDAVVIIAATLHIMQKQRPCPQFCHSPAYDTRGLGRPRKNLALRSATHVKTQAGRGSGFRGTGNGVVSKPCMRGEIHTHNSITDSTSGACQQIITVGFVNAAMGISCAYTRPFSSKIEATTPQQRKHPIDQKLY